jgi:hypothetical protein
MSAHIEQKTDSASFAEKQGAKTAASPEEPIGLHQYI